jgi:hypothetical protein
MLEHARVLFFFFLNFIVGERYRTHVHYTLTQSFCTRVLIRYLRKLFSLLAVLSLRIHWSSFFMADKNLQYLFLWNARTFSDFRRLATAHEPWLLYGLVMVDWDSLCVFTARAGYRFSNDTRGRTHKKGAESSLWQAIRKNGTQFCLICQDPYNNAHGAMTESCP